MRKVLAGVSRFALTMIASAIVSGCAFLPGFSLFESPTLYYVDVAQVASRITCEVREFVWEHNHDESYKYQKWALADDDIKVVLTLTADESGYVNFTGINASQLGASSLQALITTTTSNNIKIPTLAAKMTGKRAKTVTTTFSISAKPLLKKVGNNLVSQAFETPPSFCSDIRTENPINSFYLKDYLNNYFDTVNYDGRPHHAAKETLTSGLLRTLRPISGPPSVPSQLKIQSVQLTTAFTLAADVSAGATPTVLGDGTVFIVPINGLGVDYNPDYVHKVDMTFNICDLSDPTCDPSNLVAHPGGIPKLQPIVIPYPLWQEQCTAFAIFSPLLSGVKPPKDFEENGVHKHCSPDGTVTIVEEVGKRGSKPIGPKPLPLSIGRSSAFERS